MKSGGAGTGLRDPRTPRARGRCPIASEAGPRGWTLPSLMVPEAPLPRLSRVPRWRRSLGGKHREPIREPRASRSRPPDGQAQCGAFGNGPSVPLLEATHGQAAPLRRLEFQTYTNIPMLFKHVPNRHLCWLRQYFLFIAAMRFNIFPEITSEQCAWILNTCDPDIRGETLCKTHRHTRVGTHAHMYLGPAA